MTAVMCAHTCLTCVRVQTIRAMKSTTVATLLLVAAVTLRSGEAQSCTCKKANAKLNDASDQTACRSLSSSQSAPEMVTAPVRGERLVFKQTRTRRYLLANGGSSIM